MLKAYLLFEDWLKLTELYQKDYAHMLEPFFLGFVWKTNSHLDDLMAELEQPRLHVSE